MKQLPVAQWRGAKDLIQDAVLAGADAAERLQLSVARQPYAVLKKIAPIALPVQAVEQVQNAMTVGVYGVIRSVTRWSASLADRALDMAERNVEPKAPGDV